MYAQKEKGSALYARWRKRGGQYLKALRLNAGLTQRELADKVGLEYYTFISQVENGHGRVPTDLIATFAEALGVPTQEFTQRMLMYYDPVVYANLWGPPGKEDLTLPKVTGDRAPRTKRRARSGCPPTGTQ